MTKSTYITILFVSFICCAIAWMCHAAKTTFVITRSEKTEKEAYQYPKRAVIHTYLFAGNWVLAFLLFFVWNFVSYNWDLEKVMQWLNALAIGLLPVMAYAGIFLQKIGYARIMSGMIFLIGCILFYFYHRLGLLY